MGILNKFIRKFKKKNLPELSETLGINSTLKGPHKYHELNNKAYYLMREKLAKEIVADWADWNSYMFRRGKVNSNGTMTMPKKFVDRWKKELNLTYETLNRMQRDAINREAELYLKIMKRTL